MTAKIPYVLLRGNTYHFRIAIPKDLRGHSELPSGSQIQKSLGTSDIGVAKREALKMADEWKIRFDALSVGGSVKLVGTIRLDEFTAELVRTGTRSDLEEFRINFFPHIENVLNGYLAGGGIPPPSAVNKALNATSGYLPNDSTIQLDASDSAAQGELRAAIKALILVVAACMQKIDNELENVQPATLQVKNSPQQSIQQTDKPEKTKTVGDCLEEILRSGERKSTTIIAHRKRLGWFLNATSATLDDSLRLVFTKERLITYKEQQIKREMEPQTLQSIFSTLKMISRYSHREGWLPLNPCANIQLPKVNTTTHQADKKKLPYSLDEIHAIAKRIDERCVKAENWRSRLASLLMKTCLLTGCRVKEAALMHGHDVDLPAGTWTITDKRPDQELKTSQSARTIPLHPALLKDNSFIKKVQEAQSKGDTRVFTTHLKPANTINAPSYEAFVTHIKNPLVQQGIIKDAHRKDFHSLRRTFATQWNAQSLGAVLGEMYLGHQRSDISSVGAGYDHHDYIAEMRDAIGKLKL